MSDGLHGDTFVILQKSAEASTATNIAIFGLGRIGKRHLHNLVVMFRVNIKWIVDDVSLHGDIRRLLRKYKLENEARLASPEEADTVYSDTRFA